jgi:hypothetical protein
MPNPFQQRATDRYRDAEAFLSIVTPGPIVDHLKQPAEEGRLYDRLVVVTGTPGSGKTTMAKLLQLDVIDVLRRNRSPDNREILASLSQCKVLADGHPAIAAVRIPMESEYRECWELPYPSDIKNQLLAKLIQARTVLAWIRALRTDGAACSLIPKVGSEASMVTIGGNDADNVERMASEVELGVYKVVSALVAPPIEELPEAVRGAYRPFDIIEAFERVEKDDETYRLTPLVLLDDAHSLHPEQRAALMRDLIRRELRIGRWMLMRLDALTLADVLKPESSTEEAQQLPGTQLHRDATVIPFQGGNTAEQRKKVRKSFENSAEHMANRYLARMPAFMQRGIREISAILPTEPDELGKRDLAALARHVDTSQENLGISARVRAELEDSIRKFAEGRPHQDLGQDVQLAALNILMHRYQKRNRQTTMFEAPAADDENVPAMKMAVVHGARLHLMHWHDRPYYYGFDSVRDASAENAELFLHFAGHLVEQSEVRLIRGNDAALPARTQHDLLRAKARDLIAEWNFPYHREVLGLVRRLAERCLERSLLENAPLDAGASAFGIPQAEMDTIVDRAPKLSRALHFGVAYKAFQLTQHYKQGEKGGPPWCLVELGGFVRVAHGLTHHRGGFIESSVDELETLHAAILEKTK